MSAERGDGEEAKGVSQRLAAIETDARVIIIRFIRRGL